MPNGHHSNRSSEEKKRKRVAELLVYASRILKLDIEDRWVEASEDYYGGDWEVVSLEEGVKKLCSILHKLSPQRRDQIVYNARSRESRHLADWWEDHQAEHEKQLKEAAKKKRTEELKRKAKAKLTSDEYKAIIEK